MSYFIQPFKAVIYLYKRHALTPFRKQFWQVLYRNILLLLLIAHASPRCQYQSLSCS